MTPRLPPYPQAVAELIANQGKSEIGILSASSSDDVCVVALPPDGDMLSYVNERDVVEGNNEI